MTLSALFTRLFSLLATTALAAAPAQDPCVGVPGGCAPVNMITPLIPVIGSLLVGLAGGGAVLFVVIGGIQMILSAGDDGAGNKGKMSMIYALGGFMLALASQAIVTFVHTRVSPLAGASTPHLDFMAVAVSAVLSLLNVAFIGIVIYAAILLVIAWGKQDAYHKSMNMILWAIIGTLIINAANAIVHAVLNLGL
ncbi:MAG: hypothetical protein PHX87_04285 [Candidatus Peribacteraceae bacterium]|nr:hypothetical protein [Candidatus Peribacteraceae bacterium]MDD5742617.1 hypothetical protein [Candidatus Peribacteraceae bacterium]